MGWNSDQPPVNYLKRRIIYYKKKKRKMENLINSKILIKQYGENQLDEIIQQTLQHIDSRIKEFEKAAKQLTKQH